MKIESEVILNLKRDGATSTLLILDKVHILLDCGLNANMDFSAYENHLQKLKEVDIILLSHVGAEFVGALPYLLNSKYLGNMIKTVKIYSTAPVMKLGLFNAYNQFLNGQILANIVDEQQNIIENTFNKFYFSFDKCKQVQFFQKKVVRVKHKDIIISPICIGNSLGACAWIIQDNLINVMYMIQFGHHSDYHLEGINFKKILKKRIDVLITEQSLIQLTPENIFNSSININNNVNNYNANNNPINNNQNNPQSQNSQPPLFYNKKTSVQFKETLKLAIQKAKDSFSFLVIVSTPSERVIEIIMILWQLFNEAKKNQEESVFPPIDFFHNYKNYLQDLVNSQIKYMRKEAADILVEFHPLSTETNFINFQNVLNMPGPRIIVTTSCCLYFPKMFEFIQNMANNDKDTLLFVGKPLCKSVPRRQQWIRQGFIGGIKEDEITLSEQTQKILKQFKSEEQIVAPLQSVIQTENNENNSSQEPLNTDQSHQPLQQQEDLADDMTIATVQDTEIGEIDGKGFDMDKDVLNNEEEEDQLFEYKQKDYYRYIIKQIKYKRGEFGEELTEEEKECLTKISNRKKKKNQPAARSYQTPEQIAHSVFKQVEDTRYLQGKFTPFLYNSIMNILEFNIVSLSDDTSVKNIINLLNPIKIFYINQAPGLVQEKLEEETDIHNQSLDIFNFKNKIKLNGKMQGMRFIGKVTMVYNRASTNKVNLTLEQEANSQNPNRDYYGDYPMEKLLEYLQKQGYTFTVAWGGINYQDKVIIKKNNQNFSLEGIRCKEFYEIRKLVYDFLQS